MAYFVELTSIYDHPVLINVDGIAYLEPSKSGVLIHMGVSRLSSSDNGGTLRSVSGNSETIHVKESYQLVKRKMNEL